MVGASGLPGSSVAPPPPPAAGTPVAGLVGSLVGGDGWEATARRVSVLPEAMQSWPLVRHLPFSATTTAVSSVAVSVRVRVRGGSKPPSVPPQVFGSSALAAPPVIDSGSTRKSASSDGGSVAVRTQVSPVQVTV